MNGSDWRIHAAETSLNRLLPKVEQTHHRKLSENQTPYSQFKRRLNREWERLFIYLHDLYGWQYDFFFTLEMVLDLLIRRWLRRPSELRELDDQRENNPRWFISEKMVGIVLYVDLFSNNLAGLKENIPYFERLGVTYLHLMPLFAVPHDENDGGYAVSDYRSVNPDLGTMEDLAQLSAALREKGISLVLDFVLNHTSDEHIWAQKAKQGNPEYLDYYFTFPDRSLPDQYQIHLRDIFPSVRKGNFTWNDDLKRWVWTTFNSYQWDLNYSNPAVFLAMAGEMLFLANNGVEILRLDAVAFLWKRLGTNCENQPEAHTLIRALNAVAKITAPTLIFKSEAIVHPDEMIKYIHPDECQLSYNPLLMALVWEALATREVKLLVHAMRNREIIPRGCSWVNYLRCHDDIGWTFDDEDAWQVGINPKTHRDFLNQYYTGRYPGSFARGMPFQFNPENGDLRISGTLSSLAGLEEALEKQDEILIKQAVNRINMMRSIQVSIGGIPLLYAGDEYGMLNDYTFLSDPAKANDTRWVHRARKRWEAHEDLSNTDTLEWRFFHEMTKLFYLRKQLKVFRNGGMEIIDTGNPHLFGYIRKNEKNRMLVVNNFSELKQTMPAGNLTSAGMAKDGFDAIHQKQLPAGRDLVFEGYEYMWIDISET